VCESEDTATESGDYCPPPDADAEHDSVYPSIEVLPEDPQTWFIPDEDVDLHCKERKLDLIPRFPFVPTKPEVKFYEFILEDKDAVVQYLFEPAGQSVACIASSETEWERKLYATIDKMLSGVPFGKPIVSVTSAPLFANQYGGKYLDIVPVSWQKCFL
jgi:hypothetical protein